MLLSKRMLNEIATKRKSLFEHAQIKDTFESIQKNTHFDIFLSYSYSDRDYAIKIYHLMCEAGYKVYIDLNDEKLDREDVDEKTAKRISQIMNNCDCLVYVHTPSAKVSKWCPWELGYMSGRTNFRCAIIPLIEDKEDFPHQEYLGLYPVLEYAIISGTNKYDFWAYKYKTDLYIILSAFIKGQDPFKHKK